MQMTQPPSRNLGIPGFLYPRLWIEASPFPGEAAAALNAALVALTDAEGVFIDDYDLRPSHDGDGTLWTAVVRYRCPLDADPFGG